MDTDIDTAKKLGYDVTLSIEGYEGHASGTQTGVDNDGEPVFKEGDPLSFPDIYRVTGHGVSTQIPADDSDAWKRLTNKKAHDYRVMSESGETDPKVLMQANLDAAVDLGDMKKSAADKIMVDMDKPTTTADMATVMEAVMSASDFNTAKANLQKLMSNA